MCATRTALGSPLVPEVKISMKVSAGVASRCGLNSGAAASRCDHASESTSKSRTPGRASPSSSPRWASSVSRIWQSARMMSRARASPRRVLLMPAST